MDRVIATSDWNGDGVRMTQYVPKREKGNRKNTIFIKIVVCPVPLSVRQAILLKNAFFWVQKRLFFLRADHHRFFFRKKQKPHHDLFTIECLRFYRLLCPFDHQISV
jgi:hypothetical protein